MMNLPRSRTTDQRFYGLSQGIVVDAEDPLREGRVKLTLPWFDENLITDWCRVSQLYAGNGYGSLFVPEVGDEVLIAFIHGDMRFPIVIGGLYNGKDKPATARSGLTDQKLIRTKGGHQILLDDSFGSKAVTVTTDGDHSVSLDDARARIVIETPGGVSSITLEDAATITVRGAVVRVEALSIELGAAASEPLVLGNQFMQLFNNHIHVLAPPLPPFPTTPTLTPMSPAQLSRIARVAQT